MTGSSVCPERCTTVRPREKIVQRAYFFNCRVRGSRPDLEWNLHTSVVREGSKWSKAFSGCFYVRISSLVSLLILYSFFLGCEGSLLRSFAFRRRAPCPLTLDLCQVQREKNEIIAFLTHRYATVYHNSGLWLRHCG